MTVFIVEQGEFCEGAVVCGVFSSIANALDYVMMYYDPKCWELTREYHWEYGCDYVEINEYEVF